MALTEHGLPPDLVDESQIEALDTRKCCRCSEGNEVSHQDPPRAVVGSCKMPEQRPALALSE